MLLSKVLADVWRGLFSICDHAFSSGRLDEVLFPSPTCLGDPSFKHVYSPDDPLFDPLHLACLPVDEDAWPGTSLKRVNCVTGT